MPGVLPTYPNGYVLCEYILGVGQLTGLIEDIAHDGDAEARHVLRRLADLVKANLQIEERSPADREGDVLDQSPAEAEALHDDVKDGCLTGRRLGERGADRVA